jgi:hypothetical protein
VLNPIRIRNQTRQSNRKRSIILDIFKELRRASEIKNKKKHRNVLGFAVGLDSVNQMPDSELLDCARDCELKPEYLHTHLVVTYDDLLQGFGVRPCS